MITTNMETTKELECKGLEVGASNESFEELIQPKEIETDEIQPKEIELTKEDVASLKQRTKELFEIMDMCPDQAQLCRNEIIELNIRLVPHVLRKYKPFSEDQFQLGCLGLIIATHKYDPSRGVPFPNFACFCIERELHKSHRKLSNSIEFQLGNDLTYMDEALSFQNGDEASKHDSIEDESVKQSFEDILTDHNLTNFFGKVIVPSIEKIGNTTKGQASTVDFEKWKALELRYILEMAEVDSQKARLTLTEIAKELGVSVQNIRMRHIRVIETIKERCLAVGLYAEEEI